MTIIDVRHLYTQMLKLAVPHIGAVLHHSARRIVNNATLAQEQTRLGIIDAYHRQRGFSMGIGYHFVAFPSGRLYQVGNLDTQRAHVAGKNHLYMGICVIGDYSNGTPTEAAQDAVREALAFSGQPLLGGHREFQSDKVICPGFWPFEHLKLPKPGKPSYKDMAQTAVWGFFGYYRRKPLIPLYQTEKERVYERRMPR